MATTFDESCILSPFYSAQADGGPDFASVIVRSGNGGAIAARNSNREDYVSRYEIEYAELTPAQRKDLRKFAILRDGMARGFRFLAPDESELERERVGWLNPATGEVEYLSETTGALSEFYLVHHFSDQCNNYTRRIVKPSPFDDVLIEVFGVGDENTVINSALIPAGTALGAYDVINETVSGTLLPVSFPFTFNFHTGKLSFVANYFADNIIKVTCSYHLPVAFSEDWHKFSIDEAGISSWKIGVEEILPAELGIV